MTMEVERIPLALYLWKRIASLGIEHVFGVPGDFNLTLIDHLYEVPGLSWPGTCNELNAAYAADGHARIKETPGALLTTYAVGELSAMNGVAGAYAEHSGMIHIVGMPSRPLQRARILLHHTLEPNMDQTTYVGMSEPIRKTYTLLNNEETATAEIDRVIVECARTRLPVFIYIPTDVVGISVDAQGLDTPLDTAVKNSDSGVEDLVVEKVLKAVKDATRPAILADVLAIRHGGQELTRKLVDVTHFPSYSTPMSKGVIHEDSPYYNGVYNGEVSFSGIKSAIESSDLILNIGPLLSDSNTGNFTRNIAVDHAIVLAHDFCQVFNERYQGLHFLPILKRIVGELENDQTQYSFLRSRCWTPIKQPILSESKSGPITQAYLWQRIGRFLKPNDILFVEVGTAQFGMLDATLPANVSFNTQMFWSSIGFSVGATLGACIAAKELNRAGRVILIVGDGSLQMAVQEVGSYVRFGLKPVIFLINNDGYSIERAINGPQQRYNDISPHWDYQKMLDFFGARTASTTTPRRSSSFCRSIEDVDRLLGNEKFGNGDCMEMCEIKMDKFDYPWRLNTALELVRKKR